MTVLRNRGDVVSEINAYKFGGADVFREIRVASPGSLERDNYVDSLNKLNWIEVSGNRYQLCKQGMLLKISIEQNSYAGKSIISIGIDYGALSIRSCRRDTGVGF